MINKLKQASTEELLTELISRSTVSDAPFKTTYGDGMKMITVGIGKDEIATISIHKEGIDFLEEQSK